MDRRSNYNGETKIKNERSSIPLNKGQNEGQHIYEEQRDNESFQGMFYSISHHQDFKNERTFVSPPARTAIKIGVQVFMKIDTGRR